MSFLQTIHLLYTFNYGKFSGNKTDVRELFLILRTRERTCVDLSAFSISTSFVGEVTNRWKRCKLFVLHNGSSTPNEEKLTYVEGFVIAIVAMQFLQNINVWRHKGYL